MTVYMASISIILFLGLALAPKKSKQRKKTFLFLSSLLLILIAGFRDYSVGVDTATYANIYYNIDYYNVGSTRFEIGFIYLFKLLHNISVNPGFMLIVVSIIDLGCTAYFIGKFSKDPMISVLLFVLLRTYFGQMNTIRAGLAIAISLVSFAIIIERRSIKRVVLAALILFVAGSIHSVTYVTFAPFAIWVIPITHKSIVEKITPTKCIKWSIILSIVCFAFYPAVMSVVSRILPQYVGYFFGTWSDSNYVASLIGVLISFAFLFVGCLFMKKRELDDTERFALLMITFAIIFGTLSMRMEIWSRIVGIFSVYIGLLWAPAFLQSIHGRNRFVIKSTVIAFSWLYLIVVFVFRPEWDGVVPYIHRLF